MSRDQPRTTNRISSPWIVRPRPVAEPRLRLFCCAHAGGGASLYRGWAGHLSDKMEVCAIQPPGREERTEDCPYGRLEPLVTALADQLRPWLDVPYALFGHELGALVCFELVRRLRRMGLPTPVRLIAAGCPAPHVPRSSPPIHKLPDNEFLERLAGGLATVPDAVRRRPDLLARILPGLKADFAILETYQCRPEERLPCPITALGGTLDTSVSADAVAAWGAHTSTFSLQVFPGDKYFLHKAEGRVLTGLASLLQPDYS